MAEVEGGSSRPVAEREAPLAPIFGPPSWTSAVRRWPLDLLLFVPIAFGLVVAGSSFTYRGVGRDAGVFLYTGQQILRGGVPYMDVWDHKGPVIYLINALGLLIGFRSVFGIVLLECLSLYAAAVLGYRTLKREFGAVAAAFGSVLWLIGLWIVFEGGDLTEEFALLFQFLAIYLFSRLDDGPSRAWRLLGIGAGAALCFFLRPNLIAVQVSIALYLLAEGAWRRSWRSMLGSLSLLLLGALLVLVVFVAYLAYHRALPSFFDQFFTYNLVYSGVGSLTWEAIVGRFEVVRDGLGVLAPSLLPLATVAGTLAAFPLLWRAVRGSATPNHLLVVGLIGLPVAAGLVAASGRGYSHYFMAWLPLMAVLAAYLASVLDGWRMPGQALGVVKRLLGISLLVLVPLVAALPAVPTLIGLPSVLSGLPVSYQYFAASQSTGWVADRSAPDDYLLIWGAEASENFLSGRRSPTRYVYQYPLYTAGYQASEMARELLADLERNRPRLIVDTSNTNDSIPPLDERRREVWLIETAPSSEFRSALLPEMADVFAYVQTHYRFEAATERGWSIYVLTDDAQPG